MPKTKISEYSTTNADNTDIESINIAEGCAPSGINNAIRELMVHLKEFQTGASGDGFTFAGGTLMTGTNTLSGTNVLSGSTTAAFAAGSASAPSIAAHGDTNTGIFFPAADTIAFAEGGAEAMRIDSSGNVGIGTSSPTTYGAGTKLAVVGSAVGGLSISGGSGSVEGPLISLYKGTTAKSYIGSESVILGGTSDNLVIWESGANSILFYTNSAERARITSGGDFLFGGNITTSGAVNGLTLVKSGSNTPYFVSNTSVDSRYHYYFQYNGTTVGSILTTTTATSYGTSSDYRLKENVAPLTNALATVAQLKPSIWTWKVDGSTGQGFIAHELQEVVPDCVTGEKDATEIQQYEVTPAVYEDVVIPAVLDEKGNEVEPERTEKQLVSEAVMGEREVPVYQGVDTSFLVATLTAAIQELKAELDATKAEVAAMKAQ